MFKSSQYLELTIWGFYIPVYTLFHHAVHKAMKLVLCQIQMEPEEQKSNIWMKFLLKTLMITPVFHRLYRARVVVEAGKLRACSDDIHEVCELVLVLPRRHQTLSVFSDNNKSYGCFYKTYPGVLIFWSRQTYHCPLHPSHQQTRESTWMANSQTRGSKTKTRYFYSLHFKAFHLFGLPLVSKKE